MCKAVLLDGHERTIRSVAWSPCGNILAAGSFDATVTIWDKHDGEFKCTSTLEGHENEVKSIAWSSSGSLLATCSRDKSVWVWEVLNNGEEFECAGVLHSHTQDVKCVRWHPHNEILASASYDNTIKMYRDDDDDWVACGSLDGHESTVWSIAFNNSGDKLASCSADQTVRIWRSYKPGNSEGIPTPDNNPVWKSTCTISGYHHRPIYSIDWSFCSGLIATGCGDDTIRIFKEEPSSPDPNQTTVSLAWEETKAHTSDINCVCWHSKDPTILASCSDDRTIKIWTVINE